MRCTDGWCTVHGPDGPEILAQSRLCHLPAGAWHSGQPAPEQPWAGMPAKRRGGGALQGGTPRSCWLWRSCGTGASRSPPSSSPCAPPPAPPPHTHHYDTTIHIPRVYEGCQPCTVHVPTGMWLEHALPRRHFRLRTGLNRTAVAVCLWRHGMSASHSRDCRGSCARGTASLLRCACHHPHLRPLLHRLVQRFGRLLRFLAAGLEARRWRSWQIAAASAALLLMASTRLPCIPRATAAVKWCSLPGIAGPGCCFRGAICMPCSRGSALEWAPRGSACSSNNVVTGLNWRTLIRA